MTTTLSELTPRTYAEKFAEFITAAPTSFHAAAEIGRRLSEAGFALQDEKEAWGGERHGFVIRDGAVIAWQIPESRGNDVGFRVVGSHTDSPSLKLKPAASGAAFGYGQVNVEVYGGPLLNSWLNRDLGVAGRVVTIDGEVKLVKLGPTMIIPQVAPHLDRSVNKELKLSAQRDLHPIWTVDERNVMELVAEQAGVAVERIAGTDLLAYDTQAPEIYGGDGDDFFVAPRQDNLTSVFAALAAFLDCGARVGEAGEPHASASDIDTEDILIFAAFDHEEIGSRTPSGAAGPFLESVLRRIAASVRGEGSETFERMIANSSCISADAGHAVNPNKAELHEPYHQPVLGGGPLLKLNANGAYASESQGSALFLRSAALADVPAVQPIVSNNDVPSGSTIGPITATRLGMTTVDCGVPLLSMHSVREVSSPRDLLDLARILWGYYQGA